MHRKLHRITVLAVLLATPLLAQMSAADEALFYIKGCGSANFGDWGIDDGPTPTQEYLALTNDGDATGVLVISSITYSGDASEFTLTDSGNDHLPPFEARVLAFRFDPTSLGPKSLIVHVETTNGGPATCVVTGNGTLEGPTPTATPPPAPTPDRETGDLDGSGCTDLGDVLFLLDNWFSGSFSPPIGLNDFLNILDHWRDGPNC